MAYRIFILFFLVLTGLAEIHAQKLSWQEDPLDKARQLMETDPEAAIDLIRIRLNYQRGRPDDDLFVNSYILLGDIYGQIGQFDLAVDRYTEAWKYTSTDMKMERHLILSKKGNALLEYDADGAKNIFEQCLNLSYDIASQMICQEGLADVLIVQDSINQALLMYREIENYYVNTNATKDLVRVQSKLAQLYLSKNDVPTANLNFQNAYRNNAQSPSARQKDRKAYEQAKEQVISNVNSDLGAVQIRQQNVELKKDDPKYQAVEQLKLADLYVKMNQPNLALKTLSAAEKALRVIDAPDIKSEISKKTSEVYVKQGDFENAMKSLQSFEEESQLVIQKKELELDQQISIVKNQLAIDMDDKEFVNKFNKQSYDQSLLSKQKYIIGLLSLLLGLAAISIFIILRNIKAKNRANKLLELKGLRAQMNPHFLFNALNTVNEYIVLQDERKANQYLTEFSALMRMILENSQRDLIPIADEIEGCRKYIELEHRRFEDKFEYQIEISEHLPSNLMVPPLLFQPYLENAIWHGLRYKNGKGRLKFKVEVKDDRVMASIKDNGIGRKKSMDMKTANQKLYKSTGIQNTGKRMQLINEIYNKSIKLNIENLEEGKEECGTQVEIVF
jgi:hypothetical protein